MDIYLGFLSRKLLLGSSSLLFVCLPTVLCTVLSWMPSKCDCPVEVSEMRPFSAVSVGSEAFSHFCMRHRPEALTKQFDLLKCLPAVQETRVRSLGREDPLGKEMATHSSTLAWKIPWSEEPRRLQSMGSQRVGHDWAMTRFAHPIRLFWIAQDMFVMAAEEVLILRKMKENLNVWSLKWLIRLWNEKQLGAKKLCQKFLLTKITC